MIRFGCRCGNPFEVSESMAGGSVQCPRCKRLTDVPALDDLGHLDEEGAYKLDVDEPQTLEESRQAIANARKTARLLADGGRDRFGESRDLRFTLDEYLTSGTGPVLDERPERPRYDPLSGELVRPLELAEPKSASRDDAATAGVTGTPAKPSPVIAAPLGYVNRRTYQRQVTPWMIPAELWRLANLPVMTFALVVQLLTIGGFAILPGPFLILAFIFLAVLLLITVGHYGNVIEETGPVRRDELPTPLRDLSFSDDIWLPAVRVFAGLGLALVPMIVAVYVAGSWIPDAGELGYGLRVPTVLAGLLLGLILLPAILLTANTAGAAVVNLSPFRLLGTIRVIGWTYPGLILLTTAAVFLQTWWVVAMFDAATVLPTEPIVPVTAGEPFWRLVNMSMLLVGGVYVSHWAAWRLGLVWRASHERFPWAFQRFEGKRDDAMRQLEERRRAWKESRRAANRDRHEASANRPKLAVRPGPTLPATPEPVAPGPPRRGGASGPLKVIPLDE